MSDRAEFYRRFPVETKAREAVKVPEPRTTPFGAFTRHDWSWRDRLDYKTWVLYVPPFARPKGWEGWMEARFMVWFDDYGCFVQANGFGHVFHDMNDFLDFVGDKNELST